MGQNNSNQTTTNRTIPHSYDHVLTGSGMLARSCRHCSETYILRRVDLVDTKTNEVIGDTYEWTPVETVGTDGKPAKEIGNCIGDYAGSGSDRGRDSRDETTIVRRTR